MRISRRYLSRRREGMEENCVAMVVQKARRKGKKV